MSTCSQLQEFLTNCQDRKVQQSLMRNRQAKVPDEELKIQGKLKFPEDNKQNAKYRVRMAAESLRPGEPGDRTGRKLWILP